MNLVLTLSLFNFINWLTVKEEFFFPVEACHKVLQLDTSFAVKIFVCDNSISIKSRRWRKKILKNKPIHKTWEIQKKYMEKQKKNMNTRPAERGQTLGNSGKSKSETMRQFQLVELALMWFRVNPYPPPPPPPPPPPSPFKRNPPFFKSSLQPSLPSPPPSNVIHHLRGVSQKLVG